MAANAEHPVALYARLKDDLDRLIGQGEWQPGQRIPPETQLMARYGVSRITVRRALDELCAEGKLERMQGRGTFVKKRAIENKLNKFSSFSELLRAQGMVEKAVLLRFEEQAARPEEAAWLQMEPGQPLLLVERLRRADGIPFALEQSYLPKALVPGLTGEMVAERGLYRSMGIFGVVPDSATEHFNAANLSASQAASLGRKKGEAAMHVLRVTRAENRVVEFCNSVISKDFFRYTVELT